MQSSDVAAAPATPAPPPEGGETRPPATPRQGEPSSSRHLPRRSLCAEFRGHHADHGIHPAVAQRQTRAEVLVHDPSVLAMMWVRCSERR